MKILNLYCGIGGNRKDWGDDHKITAVENNGKIANIYQKFFPSDNVIVGDAHQYLLEHFKEFDFIWSSPPCPTHSTFRKRFSMAAGAKAVYPDMKLYEEILLLQGYFKGKYVVENVISWYQPLIEPIILQRHYFWTNFKIPFKEFKKDGIVLTNGIHKENDKMQSDRLEKQLGFNLPKEIPTTRKKLYLRNCVSPEVGKHILDSIN